MTQARFAKLVGKEVVEFDSIEDFMDHLKNGNKFNTKIAFDEVVFDSKTYVVSTVFLGINHGVKDIDKTDLWFETMVFEMDADRVINYSDLYCERTLTYDEAEQNHAKVIEMIKRGEIT